MMHRLAAIWCFSLRSKWCCSTPFRNDAMFAQCAVRHTSFAREHHSAKPSSFAAGKHHSKNAPLSQDKSAFFAGGEGEISPLRYRFAARTRTPQASPERLLLLSQLSFSNLSTLSTCNKKAPLSRCFFLGGEGEIRTLETLLTPTRFPIVRPRPD